MIYTINYICPPGHLPPVKHDRWTFTPSVKNYKADVCPQTKCKLGLMLPTTESWSSFFTLRTIVLGSTFFGARCPRLHYVGGGGKCSTFILLYTCSRWPTAVLRNHTTPPPLGHMVSNLVRSLKCSVIYNFRRFRIFPGSTRDMLLVWNSVGA